LLYMQIISQQLLGLSEQWAASKFSWLTKWLKKIPKVQSETQILSQIIFNHSILLKDIVFGQLFQVPGQKPKASSDHTTVFKGATQSMKNLMYIQNILG
jgi:hypothetical protein